MIYIQDILQAAVTRIVTGSTVANVTGSGPYTFTTAAIKNMAVGQKIKIGIELYTVTNIAGLTVTITGNVKPDPGTWVLPLNFRYGHRLEIDNILQNEAQNPANQGTQYPFLWLILNYPQRQIAELRDVVAYETDINLVLVTDTSKDYVATERLSNKFKTVFDYYFELLTAELNTSPILEYFHNDEILCTFTDRYFYGSFDKGQNVFNASYTDAREMEFAGLRVYKSICVPTPMLKNPATFTATLAGDPEAIVGTPYPFTLEVERTDTHPEANNIFTVVVAFGDGATQTINGGLAIGQSVIYNLTHTYDIAGAITISVTGSATASKAVTAKEIGSLLLELNSTDTFTFYNVAADPFTIDWGDSNIEESTTGDITHNYLVNEPQTIEITNINANTQIVTYQSSQFINDITINGKVDYLGLYFQPITNITFINSKFIELYVRDISLKLIDLSNVIELNYILIRNNLTESQIDAQLQNIETWVTANNKTGKTFDLRVSNAAPGAAGLSAKANIESAGNTVLTN